MHDVLIRAGRSKVQNQLHLLVSRANLYKRDMYVFTVWISIFAVTMSLQHVLSHYA